MGLTHLHDRFQVCPSADRPVHPLASAEALRSRRRSSLLGSACKLALLLGLGLPLVPGCLQEKDLSADALTSFEDPGAGGGGSGPAGMAANQAISGDAQGKAGLPPGESPSSGSAEPPTGEGVPPEHTQPPHEHVERPGGFGTVTPTPVPHLEVTPVPHEHVERPGGFGSTTATPVPFKEVKPKEHAHVERPAGFGQTSATQAGSSAKPAGSPTAEPAAHPHKEMPPGYGSKLPSEGKPQAVAHTVVPAPQPAQGTPSAAPPAPETPFEKNYKGKPMIIVSGTIVAKTPIATGVDVDCFAPDPSTQAGQKLVNKLKLSGSGPFKMKVPAGFGKLMLNAFADLKNDGPDGSDPQGSYAKNPLIVGTVDISGVTIELRGK